MNLWVIRSIVMPAVIFVATGSPGEAKGAKMEGDNAVQTLANFPALQRLAAKSDDPALRKFLREVAAEYRAAGYGAFAQALPKATSLVALFGKPEGSEDTGALKKARAALRHLESALVKNPRIALPKKIGESIPDYFGIASAFNQDAGRALKNLSAGKNVANFLRKRSPALLVTQISPTEFTISGASVYSSATSAITYTSGAAGVIKSSAGSLTIDGSNPYTGATVITAGNLTGSEGTYTIGSLSGTLALANITGYRWIAFPPPAIIPTEWTDRKSTITLTYGATAGSLNLESGTRLVQASSDYPIPADGTEIPAGTVLIRPTVTGTFIGVGTLTVATPTPSPTPAE